MLHDHAVPGVAGPLAASDDPPVLVMEDAGAHPSLADALLGDDPEAAAGAVAGWAAALGRVQGATARLRAPFEEVMDATGGLGPPEVDDSTGMLAATGGALERLLPRLGLDLPDDAEGELLGIAGDLDVSAPGAPGALVPGDTCPDNALLTPAGPVFLDWEGPPSVTRPGRRST